MLVPIPLQTNDAYNDSEFLKKYVIIVKKQTAAAVDDALERITWCSPIFLPKASRTWAYGKETSTHACIRLMV